MVTVVTRRSDVRRYDYKFKRLRDGSYIGIGPKVRNLLLRREGRQGLWVIRNVTTMQVVGDEYHSLRSAVEFVQRFADEVSGTQGRLF